MRRFEERTTISAPPSTVFAYVSDFARHGEWARNGLEVTKDGDGPAAVGTSFSTTAKQFGTQRERSTIIDLAPDTSFAWESTGALGLVTHRFAIAANADSTTVTKSAELTRPTFLAKIAGWRLARDIPAGLRSDLAAIKAHLESGRGAP